MEQVGRTLRDRADRARAAGDTRTAEVLDADARREDGRATRSGRSSSAPSRTSSSSSRQRGGWPTARPPPLRARARRGAAHRGNGARRRGAALPGRPHPPAGGGGRRPRRGRAGARPGRGLARGAPAEPGRAWASRPIARSGAPGALVQLEDDAAVLEQAHRARGLADHQRDALGRGGDAGRGRVARAQARAGSSRPRRRPRGSGPPASTTPSSRMTKAPSSTEKFLIASRIRGSSTLRSALAEALEGVDGDLPALLQHVVVIADGDDGARPGGPRSPPGRSAARAGSARPPPGELNSSPSFMPSMATRSSSEPPMRICIRVSGARPTRPVMQSTRSPSLNAPWASAETSATFTRSTRQ